MPSNDFLPFGTAPGANVTAQSDWAALAARTAGFSSGVASSAQINKALRQSSFAAAALAQFVADNQSGNVADDGVVGNFEAQLLAAIKSAAASGFSGSYGSTGWTKFPSGLIVQWFRNVTTTTNSGGYATFNLTFPTAFASAPFGSAFYPVNESVSTQAGQTIIGSPSPSNTGLSINLTGGGASALVAVSGIVFGI